MSINYRGFSANALLLAMCLLIFSGSANAINWPYKSKSECHRYDTYSNHHSKWRLSSFLSRHWFWKYRCNRKVTIEGADNVVSSDEVELIAVLRRQKPGARYFWSQLSGPAATFVSGKNRKKVLIEMPATSQVEDLVFRVRVKYPNRWSEYAVKTVTVSEPPAPMSELSGRITSVDGTAIGNVIVTAVDRLGLSEPVLIQTDSNGQFSMTVAADKEFVLQLSSPNYSNQVVPVVSPSVNDTFRLNNLVMIARGDVYSISEYGEQTIVAKDGSSVTFDKANFVDADSQPITGDMQLTITPVDVSNTRSINAFPGLFLGLPEGGVEPEVIASLGTVEFHFTHNGEPVSLASGATAEVLIPIYVNEYPNGQAIEAGQIAPLRSLNETTGIWAQEGTGTVVKSPSSPTGFAYEATVSHFSWWGIDVALATTAGDTTPNTGVAYAVVTVIGPTGLSGVAVIEATAAGLVNWRGNSVSIALDIGGSTSALPIPANREVCFVAYFYFDSGAISNSNTVCVNEASEATANLNVQVGQTGPIDVAVMPQTTDDTAFIQGFVNVQSPALRIGSTTIETTVNYQIVTGVLPAGLSLDIFGDFVNLIGTPTAVGEETFVIRATDADNNTDDITVTYNVSAVNPPPIIEEDPNRFFTGVITMPGGTVSVNLNDLVSNIGGPISQWREVSSTADQTECINMYAAAGLKGPSADLSLPSSVTLSKFTGELTFDSAEFWLSCLEAFNNQGTSIFIFGFEIFE